MAPVATSIRRNSTTRRPRTISQRLKFVGGDEPGSDRLLGVAAVGVGGDVPCLLAGEDRDGLKEFCAGVEQSGSVLSRVSGGQLTVRDLIAEGRSARLVVEVVVDAVAVREESESFGEGVEAVPVGVGRPADVPAEASSACAGEYGSRLPALAQDLWQVVGSPYRSEVHYAAALDQDHVLAAQVCPDVGNIRLGEQAQEAELDVGALGEPRRVVVDGVLPVADRGRDIAESAGGPRGSGQADCEVDQRCRCWCVRPGLQDPRKGEDPATVGRHRPTLRPKLASTAS